MEALRTIAITGATGLIGRALVTSLAARGNRVRALVRRPDPSLGGPNITTHTCDLPGRIDAKALEGCDAIIHAAYITRFRTLAEANEVNEIGTRRLFAFSRKVEIPRFIFITSTSAHAAARSYYGQSKYRMEQLLDPSRDLIIRPGLVLAQNAGLFARMAAGNAGSTWNIPLFAGGRQPMQTIHRDDLIEGFRRVIDQGATGTLTLASPERLTVREFFVAVAERLGRRPRLVPVPAVPAVVVLRIAECVGIRLPVSSENLLGMLRLPYWESEADLRKVGLHVRPLRESLADLIPTPAESGR